MPEPRIMTILKLLIFTFDYKLLRIAFTF